MTMTTAKEKECFSKCPKCGAMWNERHDWEYDCHSGKHWFYEYYTCVECGANFTEMYQYVGTYYEEGE